jgi:hypothetical protein
MRLTDKVMIASLIQPAFVGGEVSPRPGGRVDLAKYYSSAAAIENYIVRPLGGVTRRPSTMFAGPSKFAAKTCRLVPWAALRSLAVRCSAAISVGRARKALRSCCAASANGVVPSPDRKEHAPECAGAPVRRGACDLGDASSNRRFAYKGRSTRTGEDATRLWK